MGLIETVKANRSRQEELRIGEEEKRRLGKELQDVMRRIETVRSLFNYVTDEALIESYIYEEHALMMRARYLLKQAGPERREDE